MYRLWRDLGYAVGALLAGVTADLVGLQAVIVAVAALTSASGLFVALRMRETLATSRDLGPRGSAPRPAHWHE